jgi:COP9 signalosome complex subunit 1
MEDFDVAFYASRYSGFSKVARLQFIAEASKSNAKLKEDAFALALKELKESTNMDLYMKVAKDAGAEVDKELVESVTKKTQQTLERLEVELNSCKANLVKENIRMGHNDLGDFYFKRGELNSALKCFVRGRDYCATNKHVIDMCLNVIRVSVQLGNFMHVSNHVSKAEQVLQSSQDDTDSNTLSILKVSAGLAHLDSAKYKLAARKFLECQPKLGSTFNEVIHAFDVAVYAGLCALATFDRDELKKRVVDNQDFKGFLEFAPQVRDCILDFYSCRYASCLAFLDNFKPTLLLDIHLFDHVEHLYTKIRQRALIQYFSPYMSVNLHTMAAAFNAPVETLEKEMAALIMDGQISARIDSQNKTVFARHADERNATFKKALALGQSYIRDSKSTILRMSLMKHNFNIKATNQMTMAPTPPS